MYYLCSCYTIRVIVVLFVFYVCFFFFKQKTAYEMRISDWSSDVCSSDLPTAADALCARADGGRGESDAGRAGASREHADAEFPVSVGAVIPTRGRCKPTPISVRVERRDRKSTRLNSSH